MAVLDLKAAYRLFILLIIRGLAKVSLAFMRAMTPGLWTIACALA